MSLSYLHESSYPSVMIPHRKKELALLMQLFLGMVTDSVPPSRRILITGGVGVYKTEVVQDLIRRLRIAAGPIKAKLFDLYLDGRDDLTWDFHLHNNLTLGKIPPNVRFILILDHVEEVGTSRLEAMMSLTQGQKISVIAIANEENQNIRSAFSDPAHLWDRIAFSPYSKSQIVSCLRSYRSRQAMRTHNSNKVFHKIALYSNGSLKKAMFILKEAERIAGYTPHKTVNEEVVDLLIGDFSIEWRPINLLPEDVVGV